MRRESELADRELFAGSRCTYPHAEPAARVEARLLEALTRDRYNARAAEIAMSLRERWIDLLYRVATGTKGSRALLTPIGITIFGAVTAAFVLAALLVDRLLGLPSLLPERARLPVSLAVMALGLAATAWSVSHFLRVRGTPVPFNPPPKVVATGPYRYARNPMLTGVFLFLFGLGLAVDSLSLVFVFTPLYVLFNVWELKAIEEPELVRRFGDEYIEYRRRTPMFVPSLRRDHR